MISDQLDIFPAHEQGLLSTKAGKRVSCTWAAGDHIVCFPRRY